MKQSQQILKVALCTTMLLLCVIRQATADEPEKNWSVNITGGLFSDYMFRGLNLYEGLAVQPSVTGSYNLGDYGTLSANLWMHLSADGVDRLGRKFTELDEAIYYDVSIGPVTLSLGHFWYTFPDGRDNITDSAEFYQAITFDSILTPKFSFYDEYRLTDAKYYEISFSEAVDCERFGKGCAVTPFVAFGFASHAQSIYADNGLVHITYGVSTELALGDIKVTPNISYTSKVAENAINELWAGMTFAYSY